MARSALREKIGQGGSAFCPGAAEHEGGQAGPGPVEEFGAGHHLGAGGGNGLCFEVVGGDDENTAGSGGGGHEVFDDGVGRFVGRGVANFDGEGGLRLRCGSGPAIEDDGGAVGEERKGLLYEAQELLSGGNKAPGKVACQFGVSVQQAVAVDEKKVMGHGGLSCVGGRAG